MKSIVVLSLLLAACLAAPAAAQMPPLLSYQGVLADASGMAVPDNTYSITFSIYNVASGGSALWTETDNVVVSKGTFSALLGATSMLGVLPFDETYYIGLSIEGGPELPRQILTRTPYSFSARSVSGTDNMFPSTGKVGIGTLTPDVPLTVTSASGQVGIRFDGNDDSYASIYVNALKAGVDAGFGYETQSLLRAYTFVDPSNNWNLQMAGTNYALRASAAGNVCVGAGIPSSEKLRVDGGIQLGNSAGSTIGTIRWTGSDFEGYNGSAWQSFTLTGGGPPAGVSGQTLRYDGSAWTASSTLYNNGTNVGIGTTTPGAKLHVNGDALIGSASASGYLGLYRSGVPTIMASLNAYAAGGEVATFDENHNMTCVLKPSMEGEGGMLGVTRNTDQWGLYVEGNVNGTGSPSVSILGNDRDAIFDMSQSGDGSVWLPYQSVSSSEIADEPGVASYTNQTGSPLGTSISAVASQSITIPAAGFVLVIGTTNMGISHTNGLLSHAIIGTSNSTSSFPANQDLYVDYPTGAATGYYFVPATCHGLYYQPSAGNYTYYLLGQEDSGDYVCYENQLSLIYLPTMYGSVYPTLASSAGTNEKTMGASLTAADVAAQKVASEADNAERMRRELDELRAEVAAMKAKLETPAQVGRERE